MALGKGMLGEERKEKEKVSTMGQRKKGIGGRVWLAIDTNSRGQLVEAGKHAIMRRASLPARDLRILDPLLSHPSTILGRERAIVVNLEHIKAIITAQEVLLLNSKDPEVVPIVLDLQRRLPLHFNALGQQVPGDGGGGLSDHEGELGTKTSNMRTEGLNRVPSKTDLQNLAKGPLDAKDSMSTITASPIQLRAREFRGPISIASRQNGGPSVLPFEFRVLEVCLEAACSRLDKEASELDREAYPALDELTSKLSTLNLERVRQIKSRLVAISGRVQKVRDEIEQLLDDDGDMAEMYLTDKLLGLQNEGALSPNSFQDNSSRHFEASKEDLQGEPIDGAGMQDSQQLDTQERETDEQRLGTPVVSQVVDSKEISSGTEDLRIPMGNFGGVQQVENLSISSTSHTSSPAKLDVEELEMLLEAYFVQIEGTLNKLSTLREYVDDTEDYINIMLDDKQNHLLEMGILLTTATLVTSTFVVVMGVFGMNIEISLFNATNHTFLEVVVGTTVGCVVVYACAIAYYKYKGLIG